MTLTTIQEPAMKVLVSQEAIQNRIEELARDLREHFGNETVVLVGVLKGCFMFMADLCRAIPGDVRIDFMQVSSYGMERSSSGIVQIRKDLDFNIEGMNVVLVEDIVDSGLTLTYLMEVLRTRKPKDLKVVTLLSKPQARKHQVEVDFVGFEIPDEFVVGYGLDDGERYRNLPYVASLQ